MRSIRLTIVSIFICINLFAQFGGGSGIESDPYRIYTIEHLEEIGDSLNNNNNLYGSHLRLMNDLLEDSLTHLLGTPDLYATGFCGNLHGGGHTIALNIIENGGSNNTNSKASLFYSIGDYGVYNSIGPIGYIDSLSVVGNMSAFEVCGISIYNFGTIYKCDNKVKLVNEENIGGFYGITASNDGNIISCANYTNANNVCSVAGICYGNGNNILYCKNYGNFKVLGEDIGGICSNMSDATIIGCTNYGNFSTYTYGDSQWWGSIGGIVGTSDTDFDNTSYIVNCKNFGTIDATQSYWIGGIVGSTWGKTNVEQCANYGDITGLYDVGGIVGFYGGNNTGWVIGEGVVFPKGRIINCYNSGYIHGDTIVGGISGASGSECGDTIGFCLNTGRVYGSAVNSGAYTYNDDNQGIILWNDSICLYHNYYDAQMLAYNADNEEGMYEWKLTSQLTGDTPELRAMLGDGWSYAEGRYPIPLGLEEDTLAMLFATPIYLYAESTDDYDDVDLVQHHFTVGTENSVSWASGSRLSIVGENATILASGSENITANLAGYSFSRRLNLINPVSAEEQVFDDVKIFPNPTSDILNITSPEEISEIEIVNVMGQVVYRTEVNADNAVCDVQGLNAGVYFMRIYGTDDSILNQRKFVKK